MRYQGQKASKPFVHNRMYYNLGQIMDITESEDKPWQLTAKAAPILFTMMKMNVMFATVIWTKMKCTVF